jgi:F-type H+-transporting ATPase subunit gamma
VHLKNIKIENFICAHSTPSIDDAIKLTSEILAYSKTVECYLVYNKFLNAVSQQTIQYKFLPLNRDQEHFKDQDDKELISKDMYVICEPSADEMLVDLIPEVIATNILHVMLENAASEHGARMTAMDNASRNAGDMIKHLTIQYNRTRQASITTELIEIISGAEAINN